MKGESRLEAITIKGKVLEIIYRNDENGYTIALLQGESLGEVTVTGCLPSFREQDLVEVSGTWKVHEIYGKQLNVQTFTHCAVDTEDGAFAYLSSGAIDGVGPKMAKRIIDHFGNGAVEVLETNPKAYLAIPGIGKKKLESILESHNRGRSLRNIISALVPHGISPGLCMKIYHKYKEESLTTVQENPYSLCRDIRGIGFKKADEIARKLDAGLDSPERVRQGILYILQEAAFEGHTFLALPKVVEKAIALLGKGEEEVLEALYDLGATDSLVIEYTQEEKRVYLTRYSVAETRVAAKLIALATHPENKWFLSHREAEKLVEEIQQKTAISLSRQQMQVAVEALCSKVLIVTGGPGTGKTTTLSFLLETFRQLDKKVVLCAPTGRAAKRITEATGTSAYTIHRLLEAMMAGEDETTFFKDEDSPIEADVVIIDEISMVDILLFDNLLKAVAPGTTLILVGDKDQLPSVGAGSVFKDILDSETIPTMRLTEIFRQAEESLIVVNAHRINRGEMPRFNQQGKDFFFMERTVPKDIAALTVELVSRRLPAHYGFSGRDIQVLSPMKKSDTGVLRLNQLLQQAVNPPAIGKREQTFPGRTLRTGDRVMHIKNNYDKSWQNQETGAGGEGIFNGDMGYIDFMEPKDRKLYVLFDDGKRVEYDFTELDQVEHAFATTVHKSQGSEFPCVVMPIFAMPPMLMSRKILYTAITRAKNILVLVGQRRYLKDMVENIYEEKRNTALCHKLRIFIEEGILIEEVPDGVDIPF